jgi:hypothetical protein
MIKETTKKHRSIFSRIIRGVLYFSGGIVILAVIFIFVIPFMLSVFWGKDIPPVDDSVLQLQKIDLSESENSVYDLNKLNNITEELNLPPGKSTFDYLKSDQWDQSIVEKLLDDNKLALQYFDQAASKTKFQSKIPEGFYLMPSNVWRSASRISGFKAVLLAKNGRYEEALDEAFKSIIIGDTIARSQTELIPWLVGTAIERNGLDILQKVISMIPSGTADFSKYQAKLENYKVAKNEAPFKSEYLRIKEAMLESARLTDSDVNLSCKNNFYYKPNLTNSYFYYFFEKLIVESRKECPDIKEVTPIDFKIEPSDYIKLYFTENAIGKMLADAHLEALNNALQKRCETENKFNDALLMFDAKK